MIWPNLALHRSAPIVAPGELSSLGALARPCGNKNEKVWGDRMDKRVLFDFLKNQESETLLELLQAAYDEMSTSQRQTVFGVFCKKSRPPTADGKKLLRAVKKFHKDSFDGVYYAPFGINSKNFMHIPEETEEWCNRISELLEDSTKLSRQGEHSIAVECFRLLNELIEAMNSGAEIVFAHELGSWMIPFDEKETIKAYATSLAATATPEEFTKATLPIIRSDSIFSFSNKAYSLIIGVASKDQRAHLDSEIKKQKIRIKP
jgi:hypothetical protein